MRTHTALGRTWQDSLAEGGIVNTYARMPAQLSMAFAVGAARFMISAVERSAAPTDMFNSVNDWVQSAFVRKPPTWTTEHDITREWPIARLRDFSQNPESTTVPVLLLPPQAGHDSCVVDFADGQSQIQTIQAAGFGRVAALDWIGATQETKDTTIEDYVAVVREATDLLGGRVNLVGDCQGGWLGAIYAAMYPETVHTLTIAGAPINTKRGKAQAQQWLTLMSPNRGVTAHRMMVARNGGIWPGQYQLAGFKAMEPAGEFQRLTQLFGDAHEREQLAHYAKFADWFEHTQDLSGSFYLWVVKHIFARNELAKGTLRVAGETVDLGRIDCPIYMIAGDRDHITPAEQVWALEEYVSTPSEDVTRRLASAGHLGLFMGRHALQDHWAPVLADIAHRS
ncbi:alpha/beta fold hydrolase [[Mycobacterium] crassicus]|uniref:Alpha/beta fold hydrolase n=1 Tax=[Mycobacterium] crassicus TaxID=2872309 RepID=A0ABU5XII4_9MYCO|nr:alpha/beta fold hydrolase [Mycolicibacter sp. MYC098]MEB3022103.1 alpha/beta fold hydrolase [Mycolicibacter sp. MYC098]